MIKIPYNDDTERLRIINEQESKGLYLIEDSRTIDGNYLVFDTQPNYTPEPPIDKLELIGQEVTTLKLSNIQKDNIISILGQELANVKLQLLQLQSQGGE